MAQTRPQSDGFSMALMVEGGLALAAVLFGWLFSVPLRELVPRGGQPLAAAVVRGIFITIPMLALFWALVHSRHAALRRLREQVEWLIRELFPAGRYAEFALVALLAGIGEELLFRGVIQTKLAEWTNPMAGLVIASLIFGAAHALSKLYFILATIIGLYLGWTLQHYGEVVTAMVAHALYDFLALVYLSKCANRRRRNAPTANENSGDDVRRQKNE